MFRVGRISTARVTVFIALSASVVISGCSSSAKPTAATTSQSSSPAATPSPSTSESTSASASTSAPPSAGQADAATTAAVTRAYTTLFNVSASVTTNEKTAVLQDGPAFATDIASLAASPLTKGLSVSVTGVTLNTPTKATVKFNLLMSGKVLLAGQTGFALLQGGTWKVAADTLCGLLSLQGKGVPPACTSPAAALP